MKVLNKIKGWFYREKHYPGGVVYKRFLCFSRICETKSKIALSPPDKIGEKPPTWEGNNVNYRFSDRNKFELNIRGKNNEVCIEGLGIFGSKRLVINIHGDNNKVFIGRNFRVYGNKVVVNIGSPSPHVSPTNNSVIRIGAGTSFVDAEVYCLHSNSSILIGENCMFSWQIRIRNTDGHPIYEKGTRRILNRVKSINIGNHVWCGYGVSILKNVHIADNCIIGCHSVVCKSFDDSYCAIAGNPAKVIKTNLEWEFSQNKDFINNEYFK